MVAAIAAIAVLSSPATGSDQEDGGSSRSEKPWDTDNLRYGTYTAKTFGVPFHEYSGYTVATETYTTVSQYGRITDTRDNEPCQSGVADAFFQTVDGGRNDFPVLEITDPDAAETSPALKSWGTSRSTGCDEFTAAQDRLVSTMQANGGYYLDDHGNLAQGSLPVHATAARTLSATVRTMWTSSSRSGFSDGWHYYTRTVTAPAGYAARADTYDGNNNILAISPSTQTLAVPAGVTWPRSRPLSDTDPPGSVRWDQYVHSGGYLALPMAIGGTSAGVWCPAEFHPRGGDGRQLIGSNTGRTLTSLNNDSKIYQADKFWCRSDVRYQIGYKKQVHAGETCDTTGAPTCHSVGVSLADDDFDAFGRVNCYYTVISLDKDNRNTCQYYHPIPKCTDADTSAKREYTSTELATYTAGDKFPAKTDGTTECGEASAQSADPPTLAGFAADACVTADIEIYENRIVGSGAEPGVPASDRSLAVAAGRTAWDLDITSPHPRTASPPRDTTAGTGDADGCADGSESRADHASVPAGAARSQTSAPSYVSSSRADTAVPPNDADGDIDYSGAASSMAHRYASRVAENTCSVKLAEAEAELALLETREAAFTQWLSDYKTAADRNAAAYGRFTKAAAATSSGLNALRFNDQETAKQTYADLLAARYTSLSAALTAAKTAYDTATDRTSGSTRAAVIAAGSNSGCVAHYDREIARLKTLFAGAETAATGTGTNGISEEQNLIARTQLGTTPAISVNDSSVPYSVPSLLGVLRRVESRTEITCDGIELQGGCWEDAPGQTCSQTNLLGCRPGTTGTRTITTNYYTCPARSYSVAGTVSRTYKSTSRSASYSTTYTSASRSTESTSRSCPGWVASRTAGVSYATFGDAQAYVLGTAGTASSLPTVQTATAAAGLQALNRLSVLGSYHPSHTTRTNLTAAAAAARDTAGSSLSSLATGAVPAGGPQAVTDWQTAYKTAYDTARTRAAGHMSGTAWENFDWRYETSTLAWGSYQEDPKSPPDGCDLINIAADGTVTVEATRLDFETSSYGTGTTFGTRTDQQRTCKARRTRTPELLLMYAPTVIAGTDTAKTADSRLDTDSTASNAEFYYVDYQPTTTAERFKLYDEAEVFAIKTSLEDSPPTFCASNVPSTIYVSHAAGAMSDMSAAIAAGRLYSRLSTDVLRPAGYSATLPTDHCFSGAFANTANVKIAVFDDTAHSAMNLVYLEKDPADTSGVTILASGGALSADPAVAYPGDSAQSSSFYGATYSMPASLGSTAGWDVLAGSRDPDDPDPLDTKTKNRIVARDKPAAPNLPAVPTSQTFKHVSAMSFNIGFLDCRPDIENVVFIGNITNATEYSNQANDYARITSSIGYPMNAPTWYYPAWSDLKGNTLGQPRIRSDGSTVAVGERSGIYTHPQSARYGWVIETVNHISIDKQPISAFRNQPDVRRGTTTRPADVTLQNHREVCFGNRTATPHYRSAAAATDPLGHNTDTNPQQAVIVWSALLIEADPAQGKSCSVLRRQYRIQLPILNHLKKRTNIISKLINLNNLTHRHANPQFQHAPQLNPDLHASIPQSPSTQQILQITTSTNREINQLHNPARQRISRISSR